MATQFKALTPFMHRSTVYNPTGEIYEHENDNLVKAWENDKIVKIVEISQRVAGIEKEVETVESDAETSQIDAHEVLEKLSYKELQERAKAAGLKYTGVKAKDLIKQLKEVE